MRPTTRSRVLGALGFVAVLGGAADRAAAIESQAADAVRALPAAVEHVFRCGDWRIVVTTVSEGAGSEVYVQPITGDGRRVLDTIPVRELNDDHAQYRVLAARCVRPGRVEMTAEFEHDEGDAVRRIRLTMEGAAVAPRRYRLDVSAAGPPASPNRRGATARP